MSKKLKLLSLFLIITLIFQSLNIIKTPTVKAASSFTQNTAYPPNIGDTYINPSDGLTYTVSNITNKQVSGKVGIEYGFNYSCSYVDTANVIITNSNPEKPFSLSNPMSWPKREDTTKATWKYEGYSGAVSLPAAGFGYKGSDGINNFKNFWNVPLGSINNGSDTANRDGSIPPIHSSSIVQANMPNPDASMAYYVDSNNIQYPVTVSTITTSQKSYGIYIANPNNGYVPPYWTQPCQVWADDYFVTLTAIVYTVTYTLGGGTPPPSVGNIVFIPNETDWTNKGKISEGIGSYPVEVKYVGDNPMVLKGTATIHHDEPQPPIVGSDGKSTPQPNIVYDRQETFDVNYKLASMSVSGAANTSISGADGVVNITKEGGNLQLNAVGTWAAPEYTLPTPGAFESIASQTMPDPPPQPTGQSGIYKIDWTKTNININPRAISTWINTTPYTVNLNTTDNLSGFDSNAKVDVTDYSHYGRNNSDTLPLGGLSYNKNLVLYDGMYSINEKANDIATNQNSDVSQTYLLDGTQPDVSFNIAPGIFSTDRGAVRKQSTKGSNFAFYGTLTFSDNLSGVYDLSYSWTYGSADGGTYEHIYSSPYTYTDRYNETITREIEKPVGDNLYLHVKMYDVAGNYTYKTFGPYEDPIKMKNFEVTDVRDPLWDSVFWKDTDKPQDQGGFQNPTGVVYKVNQLPIDKDSHPTIKNAVPKKGYAFFFDITTEFMYREQDRIEIVPSFYYWDGTSRIPVDAYYNINNNPFTQIGSSEDVQTISIDTSKYGNVLIGYLSKLTLTKGVRIDDGKEWKDWKNTIQYSDGKEQWWYGNYYLPATTIFVKHGDSPTPENVLKDNNIIVNFQIIAYKNGIETLSSDQIVSYIPTQWTAEGGPKSNIYNPGDVIVYDNKYSALSDYKAYIIQ